MVVKWAFIATDQRLWAWILVNITIFIFLVLFLRIYCLGKSQLKHHKQDNRILVKQSNVSIGANTSNEYIIFERLRLICCIILVSYSLWPFQYYISNLNPIELLLLVCLSSMTDLGINIMIAVIAHRTLTSYYKIVRGCHLPKWYKLALFIWVFINGFCSCIIEILSYGFTNKLSIFDTIFNKWAYVYITLESLLFIILFRFLIIIANIFSKIYKYEKRRGMKTDAVNIVYLYCLNML